MEITIKVSGVKEALQMTDPEIVKRAAVRALNKSAASGKTAASKEIRATYNITKGDLDRHIRTVKASTKKDIYESHIVAESTLPKARLPLIQFKAKYAGTSVLKAGKKRMGFMYGKGRGSSPGAQIQVRRSGGWKTIKGSFIAKMKSGHIGVFERIPGQRTRDRVSSAIRELTSVDVPLMFSAKNVMETIKKRIQEQWDKNFMHELDYELKRKK